MGRLIQGRSRAAGPRVVAIAIVRDLYSGRAMAKIMSFVMTVFIVFPAVAPLMGAAIIAVAGWRAIFLAFVAFSAISVSWLLIPPAPRRIRPRRAVRCAWPPSRRPWSRC